MAVDKRIVVPFVIVAASLLGVVALHAGEPAATKSFTLALQPGQKESWEGDFNEVLARPFDKLACIPMKTNTLDLGEGCVDAGDREICCETWKHELRCGSKRKWEHTGLIGDRCTTNKKKKD